MKQDFKALNTTFSGKKCEIWTTDMAGGNISAEVVDIFCRDMFDEGFLWCYIDHTYMVREPCFPAGM
jgi:hypothetical protein